MTILHILLGGERGGIEKMSYDIATKTETHHFCFLKNIGPFVSKIKEVNKNTFYIFDNTKLSIFKVFKICKLIKKYAKEKDINTFVLHHGSIIIWILSILLKNKRNKVLVYAHSDYKTFIKDKNIIKYFIKKRIYSFMSYKVDNIIAISHFVKNSIKIKRKYKIIVNYNGIILPPTNYTKIISDKKIHIIFVGRLIKEKGVQNILHLLSKVEKVDYKFFVVGNGYYKKHLINLAKNLNIEDKVEFLGEKDNVFEILNNCDIFVHLPEWEEGFGITVLEAMASNLICVVNSKGAMPELIENNKNGFILEDETALLQLNEILEKVKKHECENIKIMARKKAEEFSIYNTINVIEKLSM